MVLRKAHSFQLLKAPSFRNWSKEGEMSIYEKEGGAKPCVHVRKHMYVH